MYPTINRTVVIPFRVAFKMGRTETSRDPSIPAGLGPRIKNATAPDIITEIMEGNLSFI